MNSSSSCARRTRRRSSDWSGVLKSTGDPESPPSKKFALRSMRRPPLSFFSLWHSTQECSKISRTLVIDADAPRVSAVTKREVGSFIVFGSDEVVRGVRGAF